MNRVQPSGGGSIRLWLTVFAVGCVIVVVGVIAVATRGFGLVRSGGEAPSVQQLAQERCESEVRKAMVSSSAAELTEIKSIQSPLDPDGKDLFRLMLDDELKVADRSRVTVWEISGVVTVHNDLGAQVRDRFSCRAYILDDAVVDALVSSGHVH